MSSLRIHRPEFSQALVPGLILLPRVQRWWKQNMKLINVMTLWPRRQPITGPPGERSEAAYCMWLIAVSIWVSLWDGQKIALSDFLSFANSPIPFSSSDQYIWFCPGHLKTSCINSTIATTLKRGKHTEMSVVPDKLSQAFVIKTGVECCNVERTPQATGRRKKGKREISHFSLDSWLSPHRRDKSGWIEISASLCLLCHPRQTDSR